MRVLTGEFRPEKRTQMYFQNANGAVADVKQTATAFSHRNVLNNMMLAATCDDRAQDEPMRAKIRAMWSKLEPFTDGYYVNLNDADPKSTDSNYGPNFGRLAALKKQFDPVNLFRLNSNVKPA